MNRIYVPTQGMEDWEKLHPESHWKENRSATLVAQSWQNIDGFPPSFLRDFAKAEEPIRSLVPRLIFPEHKTALDTEKAPSHTDVWVLASHAFGLASIAVEGKYDEPFGLTVGKWLADGSEGRQNRIAFLMTLLNLSTPPDNTIRYQLLHRLASAVIEAKQYHANVAICAVHSFHPQHKGLQDFEEFTQLFGKVGKQGMGEIINLGRHDGITRYAIWVSETQ